jgi:hypothetical protein
MPETRKVAAILAADVAGYSKLAGADEERTLARLRALRSDLVDPTIALHHGRVVKRTGGYDRQPRRRYLTHKRPAKHQYPGCPTDPEQRPAACRRRFARPRAQRLVASWNERQAKRMPMLFSPTVGAAIAARAQELDMLQRPGMSGSCIS